MTEPDAGRRARAVGINHVALEVGDIDEALAFYGAFLEFRIDSRSVDAAFIYFGDQFVNFTRGRSQAPDAGRHFGIAVDDKPLARQRLEAMGVELLDGRFLDFLDPWGNRVEITTYTEIQFSKAEHVLRGMGLAHLAKSDAAVAELRGHGLAPADTTREGARQGYRYCTCDVFTETRFGGNALAVLPDARGLTQEQMQRIAREFNFSETTFVLPAEAGHTRRVRIFTPASEVPFAGHPNIGTAFVLAATGEIPAGTPSVIFEEQAGPVPVSIEWRDGQPVSCELRAPLGLTLGEEVSVEWLTKLTRLRREDIVISTHLPIEASVGLPFIIAEVRGREALARVRADIAQMEELRAEGITPDLHLYTRDGGESDLRARMFAPLDGVPEDPATGSANCALVALLAQCDKAADGDFRVRIAQGVEMGRPSLLVARAEKRAGEVTGAWVGGSCVLVAEGRITP